MKRVGTFLIVVALVAGMIGCGPDPHQYNLTIDSTAGGSVTTPGEGAFIYAVVTVVDLVAEAEEGYLFTSWSGDVSTLTNINAASTTITMNGNYSITASFQEKGQEEPVYSPDPNLEAVIREAIGKPEGPIYPSDLEGLTSLSAAGRNIADLTGLEHCTNLTDLDLDWNQISDISPLAGLTNLTGLYLWGNQISDISPLAGLTNLTGLYLWGNQISDISPLANLTNLTELDLSYNQISDIEPLAGLTTLTWLDLSYNQISDIEPLVNNPGLSEGDYVDLTDNPLSEDSINTYIPELQARGVTVAY